MEDAGILPDFAGIVVSDRYQNYFSTRWEHVTGNQPCLSHLLRDYEDCAETYPGAVWPVQAQQKISGRLASDDVTQYQLWPDPGPGPSRIVRLLRRVSAGPKSSRLSRRHI